MSVREYMKFVIYRVASKGLEVFLVKGSKNEWQLPKSTSRDNLRKIGEGATVIELNNSLNEEDQLVVRTKAIEADYHDIPSLRALLRDDVIEVKEKLDEFVPDLDRGSFVAVKDAFKKVMPNEYKALKELKDIIIDRNQIMNL